MSLEAPPQQLPERTKVEAEEDNKKNMAAVATTTTATPFHAQSLEIGTDMGSSHDGSDSSNSSDGSVDSSRGRRHAKRPPMTTRKSSGTLIVPRDGSTSSNTHAEEYPPDDARAMSPRRGSEETDAIEAATKKSLRENARQVQLSLREIAESIELVRASHTHLQRQNEMLQDYIGGLTRSMSKSESKKAGKGKK